MKKSQADNSSAQRLQESTKHAYDRYASKFAETRNGKVPWSEFEILTKLLPNKSLRVLDLGCGSGRFFSFLHTVRDIKHYTGIDYSEGLIREAKRRIHAENVRWTVGDMSAISLEKESYDLIVLIASYHHILEKEKRERLLEKIYDALDVNGLVFMTNWNLREMQDVRYKVENGVFEVPLSDGVSEAECRYYYGFTEEELANEFSAAGFEKNSHFFSETNRRNIISYAYKN